MLQLTRSLGRSRVTAFLSRTASSRPPPSRAGRRVYDARPGVMRTAARRPPPVEAGRSTAPDDAASEPTPPSTPRSAPPRGPTSAPDAWVEVLDRDRGGIYYWNKATNETTELHAPPPEGFQLGGQSFDPNPRFAVAATDNAVLGQADAAGTAAQLESTTAGNVGEADKGGTMTAGGDTPAPRELENQGQSRAGLGDGASGWVEVIDRKRGGVYYWNKATDETTALHAAPPQGFTPGAASLDPARAPNQMGHPIYQAVGLAPQQPKPKPSGELGQCEAAAAPQLGAGDRSAPSDGAAGDARPESRERKDRGSGVLGFLASLSKSESKPEREGGSPEVAGKDERGAPVDVDVGQKQAKTDEDVTAPISIMGALMKDIDALMGKKGR